MPYLITALTRSADKKTTIKEQTKLAKLKKN